MKPSNTVWRIESQGEVGVPFPSLGAAMHEDPQHAEATIATSQDGLCLAEARPWVVGPGYHWMPTDAGRDVLRGRVVGLAVAS